MYGQAIIEQQREKSLDLFTLWLVKQTSKPWKHIFKVKLSSPCLAQYNPLHLHEVSHTPSGLYTPRVNCGSHSLVRRSRQWWMVNGEQLTRRGQTNVANIKLWPEARVNEPYYFFGMTKPSCVSNCICFGLCSLIQYINDWYPDFQEPLTCGDSSINASNTPRVLESWSWATYRR